MRKTKHRIFGVWNFDKEEKWLNEMAAKGLILVGVSWFTYLFDEMEPGSYEIRVELLDQLPETEESRQYLQFMEGTGAEYMGATLRWVYFRKKKELGSFDLYSDYPSRIKQLGRIMAILVIFLAVNLFNICNLVNLFIRFNGSDGMFLLCAIILVIVLEVLCLYGLIKVILKSRWLHKEKQLFE